MNIPYRLRKTLDAINVSDEDMSKKKRKLETNVATNESCFSPNPNCIIALGGRNIHKDLEMLIHSQPQPQLFGHLSHGS